MEGRLYFTLARRHGVFSGFSPSLRDTRGKFHPSDFYHLPASSTIQQKNHQTGVAEYCGIDAETNRTDLQRLGQGSSAEHRAEDKAEDSAEGRADWWRQLTLTLTIKLPTTGPNRTVKKDS